MPKPITPFCGSDVFVTDDTGRVLLIKRTDNGFWALPGGCQDLGETPVECAVRECREESGYLVSITGLLGVWSSRRYEYLNYPWKDNEFTHLVFRAEIIGGAPTLSAETGDIGWFHQRELPPLSDGHSPRIEFCFRAFRGEVSSPHFE